MTSYHADPSLPIALADMLHESSRDTESITLIPFELDGLHLALHLHAVTRILHSVFVSPLPNAPPIVAGIVDIHGTLVPVINLRRRFRLPDRAVEPTDQMVIAHVSPIDPSRQAKRTVALLVDSVGSVIDVRPEDIVPATSILPRIGSVDGIVRLSNGLLLIQDLDCCLSLDESRALDISLESERNA